MGAQFVNSAVLGVVGDVSWARQLSFGLEYLYADLGSQSYTFSAGLGRGLAGLPMGVDANLKLNIAKAALNLHF